MFSSTTGPVATLMADVIMLRSSTALVPGAEEMYSGPGGIATPSAGQPPLPPLVLPRVPLARVLLPREGVPDSSSALPALALTAARACSEASRLVPTVLLVPPLLPVLPVLLVLLLMLLTAATAGCSTSSVPRQLMLTSVKLAVMAREDQAALEMTTSVLFPPGTSTTLTPCIIGQEAAAGAGKAGSIIDDGSGWEWHPAQCQCRDCGV